MLYVLLTWALGKEKPSWSALPPMMLALVGLALALNVRTGENMAAGVAWAFASALSMTVVYYLNANALRALDGRLRTFAMTAVTAVLVIVLAGAAGAQALPRDGAGWAGLALLAVFYCIAMMALFYVLPRVPATSTGALNFEPIALLVLTWLFLGHTLSALQVVGAFVPPAAPVRRGGGKSLLGDVRASAIKLFDQRRAAVEHRALVHVALVGDLVGVDRRRLGHHEEPRAGTGGAAALLRELREHGRKARADGLGRHVLGAGAEEHQRADLGRGRGR